jgi:alanyl-tRNA synthetase
VGAGDFPPAGSNVENDEDNWMEIWNNVFMEFYRDESGTLTKLKQQNVDTGMGFERMCKTLQGKETVYESDLFQPILTAIENHTKLAYKDHQRRMRIVADHLRTAIVLINDGCIPSNVGAGYVLRMIIRRMYYNLILLNDSVADGYESFFNEIITFVGTQRTLSNPAAIFKGLKDELAQFKKTIANGTKLLYQMIEKKPAQLAGKDIFMLYDTYGFPVELTREIASEKGIKLDEQGFENSLEEAREKSRQ